MSSKPVKSTLGPVLLEKLEQAGKCSGKSNLKYMLLFGVGVQAFFALAYVELMWTTEDRE